MAIAFAVNGSDPTCGWGRYSLTRVIVPLAQVPDGDSVVNVQMQLFTADVSGRGGGVSSQQT